MAMALADSSRSVLLSIGGTRYESTRATLSQSAFFDALLGEDGAGRFAAPADGVYRVDRDGAAFGGVLEYLRHGLGDMALPDALLESSEAVAALGREAGFYALDELRAFAMKVMLIRGHDCDLPPGLLFEGRGPRAELYRLYGSDDKIVGEDLLSAFPAFYSTLNEKRTPAPPRRISIISGRTFMPYCDTPHSLAAATSRGHSRAPRARSSALTLPSSRMAA